MRNNFTPSINIIRDTGRDFFYIPTPNAKRVVGQMVDDFRKGIRAFNIIGSYGTGKSSFLLALEQSLRGIKPYFNANFVAEPIFEVIKIVGSYHSIIEAFAENLQVTAKENTIQFIFSEIYNRYRDLGEGGLLFIEVDEFGKLLEFASQNNPEKELYFVQQLAEFANNPEYNIVLVTTIHQSFESYAFALSPFQRQEWAKVKGRFREITFNEPVEQLLFLAAEHIKSSTEVKSSTKEVTAAYKLFTKSKAFTFNADYSQEISGKIYPLDLIAANVLTLSLQRYGQNERSLFSFLESTDHTSIARFRKADSPFYNLANVYEYLNFNFYSFISSKFNPDFSGWASLKIALEEADRAFESDLEEYAKIIKTIGLLSIYAAAGSKLDKTFLIAYSNLCLGIPNAETLINDLEFKKIIRYRNHSSRYILFEGTDLDIQSALIEAANKVSEITDVKGILIKYYDLAPALAKEYSYNTGTPRYFKYVIKENTSSEIPSDEVDGFINLIFNEKLKASEIQAASKQQEEAVLYGFYRNSKDIKSLLYEIEKTQKVIEENKDDKVAKRELENIVLHQQNLLNHYLKNNFYGEKAEVAWFWKGEVVSFNSKKEFNNYLSRICAEVYPSTPIFKNELVNKHKISSSIGTAKRSFFKALANNWNQEDLGFATAKFPPEKTIFITLLKQNGLSPFVNEVNEEINISAESSFTDLWNYSISFLNQAKREKTNISNFIDGLKARPFKLKQGLIGFWVPTFLFLKRDDFGLFGENGFIPTLTDEILDLISKEPQEFWIKTFDIEGVRLDLFNSYRLFLDQETKEKLTNQTFIETIKPFLTFYKQLPEYSKATKRLSKPALAIREAIISSKDPEKTFFEDFPTALNVSISSIQANTESLNEYTLTLQEAIRELRSSYDNLVERVEGFIKDDIIFEECEFEQYKVKLQERYKKLKKHLLLPHQKTFIQRLDSVLEDRKAWLSSIVQAVVGKALDKLKDEDEILLYDKFKSLILELDSLTTLSKTEVDDEKEEIVSLQLDSFVDGIKKSLVRIPKKKAGEIEVIKNTLSAALSKDKSLNIAALTRLLQELVQK